MQGLNEKAISTDPVIFSSAAEKNIGVAVLRLDRIHPVISGNKWFKLKYYLADAEKIPARTIISFGGPWSNHIVAVAAAGKLFSLRTIGLIRGERPQNLSATLQEAVSYGMDLHFLNRNDYRSKKLPDQMAAPGYYLIPEGGYGPFGAAGASDIFQLVTPGRYTHICCAAGTGTMAAGLINAAMPGQTTVVVNVLKNPSLKKNIDALLKSPATPWVIIPDHHFGGYAKYSGELIAFMNDFYRRTNIPSDFVYTAKLFFAVEDLVRKDFFPAGSSLLIIHSGGLQGNASLKKGTLIF